MPLAVSSMRLTCSSCSENVIFLAKAGQTYNKCPFGLCPDFLSAHQSQETGSQGNSGRC